MRRGGTAACVLNAANEIAVGAFLREELGFLAMADLLIECLETVHHTAAPTLDDYVRTDAETRRRATELLARFASLAQ